MDYTQCTDTEMIRDITFELTRKLTMKNLGSLAA